MCMCMHATLCNSGVYVVVVRVVYACCGNESDSHCVVISDVFVCGV